MRKVAKHSGRRLDCVHYLHLLESVQIVSFVEFLLCDLHSTGARAGPARHEAWALRSFFWGLSARRGTPKKAGAPIAKSRLNDRPDRATRNTQPATRFRSQASNKMDYIAVVQAAVDLMKELILNL